MVGGKGQDRAVICSAFETDILLGQRFIAFLSHIFEKGQHHLENNDTSHLHTECLEEPEVTAAAAIFIILS